MFCLGRKAFKTLTMHLLTFAFHGSYTIPFLYTFDRYMESFLTLSFAGTLGICSLYPFGGLILLP